MNKPFVSLLIASAIASTAAADIVAHFPMDVQSGHIVESVSNSRFAVQGNFTPENVPGAVGQALRLDGYTSYVDATLGEILPVGNKQMTFSVWTAVQAYPIVRVDTDTPDQVAIVSCLDEDAKTGFGFFIGFDGKYSFRTYIGGWPVDIKVETPMPTYQWNNLVAVVDCDARTVKVYNNGIEVGSSRCSGTFTYAGGTLHMGRGPLEIYSGPFLLTSYNGLIDEVTVWNEAVSLSTIQSWKAENPADLSIPASRFADDILRPRFHGMPDAAWTNECHGMTYADGRYHVFFQKNADGPFMARLHWGHISSENLYDWREEKIALVPGESYDIKGCWSGCVFSDDVITGGKPNIIYTGVDYARASINLATPDDETVIDWSKSPANPIIAGRPEGLSDDFRDPYFFRNGDNAYIIVGSSKNGIGTTTLHRYDAESKSWVSDGLFFSGTSAAQDGTFWEMPNITPMGDGRWLFTATPLATSTGVRTIYWTGTIGSDGRFTPLSGSRNPRNVELNARDGYGLLSPTIYNHDGKTIVMGIVPDKLSWDNNYDLGWAHCYSLPREWSLDADGELMQKPYSGLEGMRSATKFERSGFDLDGALSLSPVEGREVELLGKFVIGTETFGFKIFKNESGEGSITYNSGTGELTADFSRLNRLVNDSRAFNGIYRCSLPEFLRSGSEMKLNVFIDHSIVDIFVNDRWATSIRVFPTDADASGISAYSTGAVRVNEMRAWTLSKNGGSGAVSDITAGDDRNASVDVYNLQGIAVRTAVPAYCATDNLPGGIYVVGGSKVLVK